MLSVVWDVFTFCIHRVRFVLYYVRQLPVLIQRLMVECSSSPGSPGEVTLHVMDQPPPPPVQSTPATVTVQLRIATGDRLLCILFKFHIEQQLPSTCC